MDVFPIPSDVRYDYADSFTDKHRGTDIFAARGTPVVAVTDGIARADEDPRGGHVVYLVGEDGNRYYYAHLDSRDPVLEAAGRLGVSVVAGAALGAVGTTGNAEGTSPHLHFQVATDAGTVNPFPVLTGIDPHRNALVAPEKPKPKPEAPKTKLSSSSDQATEAGGAGIAVLVLLLALSRSRRSRR